MPCGFCTGVRALLLRPWPLKKKPAARRERPVMQGQQRSKAIPMRQFNEVRPLVQAARRERFL
jgi:hypothetical protein